MSLRNQQTRSLPAPLDRLEELALDLRVTGSQLAERIWRILDEDAWERVSNPDVILQNVHQEQLEEIAANEDLKQELVDWLERRERYLDTPGWYRREFPDNGLRGIAYFSMEFGLGEALPIYSGGLGILAGDHLKSSSDLDVPLVGIGLLYQQGYFRQVLRDDGWQLEAFPYNDPGSLPVTPVLDADGRWPRVRLELPGRTLFLRVWSAKVGKVTLYLLDSNHPMNSAWDRGITANLYAAGKDKRLLQELVLGVGGWQLIEKLGIAVDVCHLNEGHAAFAILARAASFAAAHKVPFADALRATRAGNVFTTHTPVQAAFDVFEPEMLAKYAQRFVESTGIEMKTLLALGRENADDEREPFNMAYLAMRGCCHINGVSRLHGEVSRTLFQSLFPEWPQAEVPISHVTNGVHLPTWDSVPANHLWSKAYDGEDRWLDHIDDAAQSIAQVSDEELWGFRAEAKRLLVDYVRRRLERQFQVRGADEQEIKWARHVLDPNALTLGFARRFTEYKRPNLVLSDEERFAAILSSRDRPAQFVVAGKAHPNDDHGKSMIQAMTRFARRTELCDKVVFLEDYDIALAQHLAAGIDVWVNTPRRPAEACGTSGMKMIVNGGLHCSVRDGWWDEAYSPELGWAIGNTENHGGERDRADALHFYDVLENAILPEFYAHDELGFPQAWIQRIRASMQELAPRFNANRMVGDYVKQAYLPAAAAYHRRIADNLTETHSLQRWKSQVAENWHGMRFGKLSVQCADHQWSFTVEVWLGDLSPDIVQVELCADSAIDRESVRATMQSEAPIAGAINGYCYTALVTADRPAEDFTPRIVPAHPQAFIPQEETHILWRS